MRVIFFYLKYLPCSLGPKKHSPAQSCASAPEPHVSKYFHDNIITSYHSFSMNWKSTVGYGQHNEEEIHPKYKDQDTSVRLHNKHDNGSLSPDKGSVFLPTPFRWVWDSPGFKLNRQRESSPKNKSSGKETRNSNPLSAKIKNAWSFTATPHWSSA